MQSRSEYMKQLSHIKQFVFPILGILCVAFPTQITAILPYLAGASMGIVGILMMLPYLCRRQAQEKLAYGVVLAVTGLCFLVKGANALGALGTTWAIIGLAKAAKSLRLALEALENRKRFVCLLLEFLLRLGLATVLLFDPLGKVPSHVIILGLEMIMTNIRLTRTPKSGSSSSLEEII